MNSWRRLSYADGVWRARWQDRKIATAMSRRLDSSTRSQLTLRCLEFSLLRLLSIAVVTAVKALLTNSTPRRIGLRWFLLRRLQRHALDLCGVHCLSINSGCAQWDGDENGSSQCCEREMIFHERVSGPSAFLFRFFV
ncbi:hypothetical protein JNB91_26395 [Rhizobium wenxiniae]|nr:hypothetical protein [Rhizobium wenxiniae]